MVKSVLISINPKWCELIANDKKTVEVRKTKPKLETPFKVYIYCTKSKKEYLRIYPFSLSSKFFQITDDSWHSLNGKVIGEFVCDFITNYEAELWDDETFERIQEFYEPDDFNEYGEYEYKNISDNSDDFWKEQHLCKVSCVTIEELRKYLGLGIHKFYGWHISDLKIYDEPKELSDFYFACDKPKGTDCSVCLDHRENKCKSITRPPQSWCYVEGLGCNQ